MLSEIPSSLTGVQLPRGVYRSETKQECSLFDTLTGSCGPQARFLRRNARGIGCIDPRRSRS